MDKFGISLYYYDQNFLEDMKDETNEVCEFLFFLNR
jgi:hypothetical protein